MNDTALSHQTPGNDVFTTGFELAPRPRTLEETGLSRDLVADLLLKHLFAAGVQTLSGLAKRTALAGNILEQVLNHLRSEAQVEIRGSTGEGMRYALTERGRAGAMDALTRSTYTGAAPVPLKHYERLVRAQSVHDCVITRQAVHAHFEDVVIRPELLDQLGPALHSGRAIFIYGLPGTGKTYITQRLARLLGDSVLVPHAVALGDAIVPLFDPVLHRVDQTAGTASLLLEQGHDPRLQRCRRPVVLTGGELALDMLELQQDTITRQYQAPLQLKANNGIFIIDDLGRQRAPTVNLLNRWIVPMEEQRDHLSLGSGMHYPVPFDLILVFSTNMNPLELADEAFLRRLGYKIRFDPLSREQYRGIWEQVCAERGIRCEQDVLRYVFKLHTTAGVPLLPCHPRDLLALALDQCYYLGEANAISVERIEWAWDNYFVRLADVQPAGV